MVSPTATACVSPAEALALLANDTAGFGAWVGVETEEGADWTGVDAPGGDPLAVAVFTTDPALTSAAVTV